MNLPKCGLYYITRDNIRIIDVRFVDYDWQLILDFLYLLPTHSYLYETIWLLEALTNWLFDLPKTENVVNTNKRERTESTVVMKEVANEFHLYKTHRYNIHFVLDCDDKCRDYYQLALEKSYGDYKRIKSEIKRHTLDVYCIIAREPQFTLYYPTEETIPKKFRVKIPGDTDDSSRP